jgi:hypothetical protein
MDHTLVDFGDRYFPCAISPDPGTPQCLCSRCGKPIKAGLFPVTVRFEKPNPVFGVNAVGEYRYHPKCVGMRSALQ